MSMINFKSSILIIIIVFLLFSMFACSVDEQPQESDLNGNETGDNALDTDDTLIDDTFVDDRQVEFT